MQYRLSTIFLVFFVTAASLAAFGAVWGLTAAGIVFAIALSVYWLEIPKITHVEVLIVVLYFGFLIWLLLPTVNSGGSPYQMQCWDNSHKIAIALLQYESVNGHFPPVNTCDKDGQPLSSWMVEILPWLDRRDLYDRLHKDEPWNSLYNSKILGELKIPEFVCPSGYRKDNDYSSNYIAIIGPGTIWRKEGSVNLKDPADPSLTVMAIECAENEKHWAEPYSLTAEEATERMTTGKGMRISTAHPGAICVIFADGHSASLSAEMPISLWRKLLMGELKSIEELHDWQATADDLPPMNILIKKPPPPPDVWKVALSVPVWLISVFLLFFRAWDSRPFAKTLETYTE